MNMTTNAVKVAIAMSDKIISQQEEISQLHTSCETKDHQIAAMREALEDISKSCSCGHKNHLFNCSGYMARRILWSSPTTQFIRVESLEHPIAVLKCRTSFDNQSELLHKMAITENLLQTLRGEK